MLESFTYIADELTTTLIIGSMPGVASLEAQEYYAHKHNLFWRFVFEAFGKKYDGQDYPAKIAFLKAHHLGLWDSAKNCVRQGSLDVNIKAIIPNDFKMLLQKYPNINRLLFNGQKAFQIFKRFHGELLSQYDYVILPSTSPANASIPFETRQKVWFEALTQ